MPSFISKSKQRQENIRNRHRINLKNAAIKRAKVEKAIEAMKMNKGTSSDASYKPEIPEPNPFVIKSSKSSS